MVEKLLMWSMEHYGQILIVSFAGGALYVAIPKYFKTKRNIEKHQQELAQLMAKRDTLMVKRCRK